MLMAGWSFTKEINNLKLLRQVKKLLSGDDNDWFFTVIDSDILITIVIAEWFKGWVCSTQKAYFLCWKAFSQKGVLKKFAKFTGKHLCRSHFFNEVGGWKSETLLKNYKKRLSLDAFELSVTTSKGKLENNQCFECFDGWNAGKFFKIKK